MDYHTLEALLALAHRQLNPLAPRPAQLARPQSTALAPQGGGAVTSPGTSMVPSGPNIIDGEWSEVPRQIGQSRVPATVTGGALKVPGTSLQPSGPHIIDGEWSEVPRELSGPKSAGLLEQAKNLIKGSSLAEAGAVGRMGMVNPLLAAIMGSIQGDIVHLPLRASPLPASPSGSVTSAPLAPVDNGIHPPIAAMEDLNAAQASPPASIPWWANATGASFDNQVPMPRPRPAMAPSPATVGGGQVPMPQPRPAMDAPMSAFQRNAAMMRDPGTGEFIDPQGAARAQAQMGNGSDLIAKMMGYLTQKADNTY